MAASKVNEKLTHLFKNIMATIHKIKSLCKTHKKTLVSSSETAKNLNEKDKIQAQTTKQNNIEKSLSKESDFQRLLDEAKAVILRDNKTSISNLQRRLSIGYNKAASLIEALQDEGFLSAPNNKGERSIL